MDLAFAIGKEIHRSITAWLILFTVFSVCEWAFAKPRPTLGRWVQSLSFWSIAIPVSATLDVMLQLLWHSVGIEPFVTIKLLSEFQGIVEILSAIVIIVLYDDLLFYWFHRAQHRWFWRWHAVHHSIRSLNAINSYHHVSEVLIRSLFIMIPASLFIVQIDVFMPWVAFAIWMQTGFLHSSVPVNIGPLRAIFGDNHFHRIHHSIEPKHYDRNFGALTTLWDRLFGTAYWPQPGEWPETGVTDVAEPDSIRAWIALPLKLPAQ